MPMHGTAHDADIDDDAGMVGVLKVEDEGTEWLQTLRRIFRWCRHSFDYFFKQMLDSFACLAGNFEHIFWLAIEKLADFMDDFFGARERRVDLADGRNYRKPRFPCHIQSRQCLRLDALRSVDEQNGAFDGLSARETS